MIKNFHEVRHNLFRGGAPSPRDVLGLFKNLNIKKIISLDGNDGQFIEPICRKFNIEHIIIPIEPNNLHSLKFLLSQNIRSLIQENIPTFIHCHRGKDRAGLFIALVRCLLDNWDCKHAIKEAKLLGFGTGLDFSIEKFYTKLICRVCNDHVDTNEAFDIVDNISDMNAQYRDYQMDPMQHSWAPYADESVNYYPPAYISRDWEGLGSNRQNYDLKDIDIEDEVIEHIPTVGIYDQNTQITNFTGPSLIGGGFV